MRLHLEQIKSAVDNIERYYEKEASLCERVSHNISETAAFVAEAMAKDVREKNFFCGESPLEPYMPLLFAIEPEKSALPENAALCKAKLDADKAAYLADFCGKVTSSLKSSTKLKPTPSLFAPARQTALGGKTAFAESRVLAGAFAEFKKKDSRLSASYVRSFTDACEEVSYGACDYCILPIENSREGALITVYGLIERYELFIARVCSIESDEITTKFALLCGENHGIIEIIGKQYIDLRIFVHDSALWQQIYVGSSVLGVENVKAVPFPLGYTDGYAHICTFFASGEQLFAFLLFLSALRADYTLIGAYEQS